MKNITLGGGDLPAGRLLPALGGIAAGAAIMRHLDPLNKQQRDMSPIAQFAGTQNYSVLAEMKTKAEASKGQYMGFGQAFDVGAQRAVGAGGTTTGERLGAAFGATRQTLGEFLGASTSNPAYGAAMMMAPGAGSAVQGALSQGMEVAVGSMILGVENAFKRLFN